MNFVVSSTALLNQLQAVNKVISSKNTLPILDNFLFRLNGNELVVTGSDLETTLITRMTLDNASGDGEIALDAKRLVNTLKELPEQPLTFNINTETLAADISSERGKYSLVGQNAIDFPQLPELKTENTASVQIEANVLLNGIAKSIFATANDELRPVMEGIYIQLTPENITLVASDAHKLVRYRRSDAKSGMDASFILPQKPAGLLKNILPKSSEGNAVSMEFDEKNAFFTFGNFKLICRLVEGKYPAYDSVIPQNNINKMIVNRIEFLNALRLVSVYSNPAVNLVKLQITPNELIVSAQDIDFSISAVERINCQYDGDPMDIGFKSIFLIEILSNLSSADVVVELSDPTRPGLLLPLDKENESEDILMLIMPMMVS